jgi:hypothetical protein
MVVTKADIYEKVIWSERPVCPHCNNKMKIWECPETGLSCGSGWGTPYLFVCLNDACPPFVNGWESMKKGYGRNCSYRCISFPDSQGTEMMMVFSPVDCQSGVLDETAIGHDKARGTDEDPAVEALGRSFARKDLQALLACLFDEKGYFKVRMKAAELIGELGLREAIDPLQSHDYGEHHVRTSVRKAIADIHNLNGTQECPHCAEIIPQRATQCSQCGGEVGASLT